MKVFWISLRGIEGENDLVQGEVDTFDENNSYKIRMEHPETHE